MYHIHPVDTRVFAQENFFLHSSFESSGGVLVRDVLQDVESKENYYRLQLVKNTLPGPQFMKCIYIRTLIISLGSSSRGNVLILGVQ